MFIVIEGLDGAGTTTQAGLVADALSARDLRVCLTAEPSDGPIGRVLRAHVRSEVDLDPTTAALGFCADRADHLARVIRPALAEGQWVVCDRYILSTLAYQGAEGVDRAWVLEACRDFEKPDLTVFLDVGDEERSRRMASRGSTDRYEAAGFAEALRASYLESIELLRARGHSIEVVGASAAPQEVLETLMGRLDALG